ncbi:MRN complex-interacting protein isoform X1 [Bufo bufo]|uniref:MRN complex-interacting protein isoform X1 n=1 Tax=Bufo bufo TaxID=8384 RepID=UPI001ABE3476|nr:MRN complex-interacting protein isoform X1 [Bufo bufo]
MVQEFRVLRCGSCQVFQVHQVKKSEKWACKLCGEKQSLLKVYGQGSGADCRHHVQKLNLLQGQVEQAATGSARKSCQNVISHDEADDETKQSLLMPQEPAPMSHWNKYLEENVDEEEEEEDRDHYYSHQDCKSRTVRKRMHLPYDAGDFYKDNIKETISKKKKIYEGENPSEACKFSCRITEDPGCLEWQDNPISPTSTLQTSSDTYLLMNKSVGRFDQSTSSTSSYLKREPQTDTIYNHSELRKKIGPNWSVTSSQYVLPSEDSPTTSRLSAQKISSPGLLQSDMIPKTSSSVSIQKPVIQSNLFMTDDDFDDDY